MRMSVELPDLSATEALARQLAHALSAPLVIGLSGDLGTGKTALVRALIQSLAPETRVKSPTYSLIESYELPGIVVHHLDLYRVRHPDELVELGLADLLGNDHRGGLQRLLLLLGVGAPRPVLHHQDAERSAPLEHRHAEVGELGDDFERDVGVLQVPAVRVRGNLGLREPAHLLMDRRMRLVETGITECGGAGMLGDQLRDRDVAEAAALPFFFLLVAAVALITVFPDIVMFLPRLVFPA
mgnify:CR=1 FL=1